MFTKIDYILTNCNIENHFKIHFKVSNLFNLVDGINLLFNTVHILNHKKQEI